MRRFLWIPAALAVLVLLWAWVPSLLVQRQVTAALRGRMEAGGLSVRARTTAAGLLRGWAEHVDVRASRVRMDSLVADRATATLEGVALRRTGRTVELVSVAGGTAQVQITQGDLQAFLQKQGFANASVTIDEREVAAAGDIHAGPIQAAARIRGHFYVVGQTDLHFRVTSLDLGGTDVPPALAMTMLGVAGRPIVSLRALPAPVEVDRIEMQQGRLTIHARVTPASR